MTMLDYYPRKLFRAVEALMTRPGRCTRELRQDIEAYAERLSGMERAGQPIPDELISYVTNVALHPDAITNQDIQQLKEAGYSEDAIFEITLCAGVGASLARLESGLRAVKKET